VTVLYDREAWVQVDDRKIAGLRLKFKAEKSLKGDPNTLDLHVFNLSATTRAAMQKKGATVVVVAGYKGEAQVIFSGQARTIDHVRVGSEWDTHVQCGDGEIAFAKSFSSFSFGPGAKWSDVVAQIGKDLATNTQDAISKIAGGNLKGAIDSFVQGYTASGPSVREMDRVMRAAGLEWSIQDGRLQILTKRGTSDDSAIVLSPSTGLIGSPDHGAPEKSGGPSVLKAKALLQAGIRPGRTLKLDTAALRGFYRVEKVTHEGDTHGQEWHSTIEALPL
jgi:hypothetical protein